MRLSLHEVLAIVGRLDDAHGFDTPRERFRRFLVEHMTSASTARTFLDESQQLISEQYQRALQDTVAATGLLLGFEVSFGEYERHGAAARTAGMWLSRRRLAVTVQLWSDSAGTDTESLVRALDAPLVAAEGVSAFARLCVVTPACASRHRLEDTLAGRRDATRIVSLRALMDLISLGNTGALVHDDVLRLLNPMPALEGSISLLSRLASPARHTTASAASSEESVTRPQACWVYVSRDAGEQQGTLTSVLQLALPLGEIPQISAGDSLAYLVPSRGLVAQALIASVGEGTPAADERHLTFAVGLRDIVIFDPPRVVETEQRLNLELQAAVSHEPYVRVGRHEFEMLMAAPVAEPSDVGA